MTLQMGEINIVGAYLVLADEGIRYVLFVPEGKETIFTVGGWRYKRGGGHEDITFLGVKMAEEKICRDGFDEGRMKGGPSMISHSTSPAVEVIVVMRVVNTPPNSSRQPPYYL